jgi:hypothetical protein
VVVVVLVGVVRVVGGGGVGVAARLEGRQCGGGGLDVEHAVDVGGAVQAFLDGQPPPVEQRAVPASPSF